MTKLRIYVEEDCKRFDPDEILIARDDEEEEVLMILGEGRELEKQPRWQVDFSYHKSFTIDAKDLYQALYELC